MMYKHKSKNITCTVLDSNDGYVIYQFYSNRIRYTRKIWADDFLDEWEIEDDS